MKKMLSIVVVNFLMSFYFCAHFLQLLNAVPLSNEPENVTPLSYREYLMKWKSLRKLSYDKITDLHKLFEHDLSIGKAFDIDSKLWNNLDAEDIYSKYPEIIFLNTYKQPEQILEEFNLRDISEASLDVTELIYHRMVTSIEILCLNMSRYGNMDDGGWEVCSSIPFHLSPGCLVYSFGINFDFSFDDDIGITNNCTVISFDPSMSAEDHVRSDNVFFYQVGLGPMNTVTDERWIIKSLKSITELLQHSNKTIDVLKIDIEYAEWDSLQAMIEDGSLSNVKQLVFEAHTKEINDHLTTVEKSLQEFVKLYSILSDLETKCNFRKFYFHENVLGKKKLLSNGNFHNCCYELYYINLSFL